MYSIHQDKLVSFLTGREYHFERDRDGSSRRNAVSALESDNQAIIEAANERAVKSIGRSLTLREIKDGNWLPDARSVREKIAEYGQTTQPQQSDENPFAAHIATLREKQAHNPKLAERIGLFEAKSAEWEQQQSAQRERDARLNHPDVRYWSADATALIALLDVRSDIPQEWVDRAHGLYDRLQETGDVETYKRDMVAFEAERESVRDTKARELDAKARELRAEAKEIQNAPT
ncbi:MAG: hypothetical protein WD063_08520 [Pirellulales bacterium]